MLLAAAVEGPEIAAIVLVLLGILAAAFLAAAETVASRMSVVRALRLEQEERSGADQLLWLVEHRSTTLNCILVATVFARLLAGSLVGVLAVSVVGGVGAVAIAVIVLGGVSLVMTEVMPRTWVLRDLETRALAVAPLLRLLVRVLRPVANMVVRLAPTGAQVSGPFPEDDELRRLLEQAEEDTDHALEPDERAMIRSIIELGDTVVREIMVPRPDMVTVGRDDSLSLLVNLVIEHGYSRLPVIGDDGDDILGVVHAKDVLRRMALRPGSKAWHDLIRPPTFVPELQRTDDLLRTLRDQQVHQAIVVDEYGAVSGLVTIEDILEEIVGEIVDEHDNEEPLVAVDEAGTMRIDARLPMGDFNELVGEELPDENWDTVGGLVVGMFGRVPEVGESLQIGERYLEVTRVQGRRVAEVVVGEHDGRAPDEPRNGLGPIYESTSSDVASPASQGHP